MSADSINKGKKYHSHAPFTFIEKVQYMLLSAVFGFAGLLPFRLIYLISDLFAWLADDLIHYRRRVVESNLRSSFPELEDNEIKAIRKRFYRFLTDYFLETLKMGHMKAHEMELHMRFENLEEVAEKLSQGKNVTLLLGHYCNWEWVSSLPLHFPKEAMCGQIYHILHNRAANKAFLKLRSQYDAVSIPMDDTLRVLVRWQREGKASVVGYIADQSPKPNSIHHWLEFLHHDTPVFTGPERISRMLHTSVYYIDMRRDRRGYYTGRFELISEDAAKEPDMRITEEYFRMLETTIRRSPEYWLWSHRRWKRRHNSQAGHTDMKLRDHP